MAALHGKGSTETDVLSVVDTFVIVILFIRQCAVEDVPQQVTQRLILPTFLLLVTSSHSFPSSPTDRERKRMWVLRASRCGHRERLGGSAEPELDHSEVLAPPPQGWGQE